MIKKPPGETITVELLVSKPGQDFIGGGAYPDTLYFFYTGRQFFNLTLRLQEDTPPGKTYLVDVDAKAVSKIGYDNDVCHLTVQSVPDLAGKAMMVEPPPSSAPGEITSGIVGVTNSGTMYAEYLLSVSEDLGKIVEDVYFTMEIEMTPNWVENAPFDLVISDSARPGDHHVVLNLLVVQDSGATTIVDRFEFEVTVVEVEEDTFEWGSAMVIVLIFVVIAAIVFIAIRRRA